MQDHQISTNQTVLISGNRIHSIGPTIQIPSNGKIIAAEGKYLMPGLAEIHGHTPVPGGDATSQFVEDMMFLYIANGVTTVRGMLGAPGQLQLKKLIEGGEIDGPMLYLASPSFSGQSITSEIGALNRVRDQVAAGWDLLKVHPGLTRGQYDAMANEANRAAGLPPYEVLVSGTRNVAQYLHGLRAVGIIAPDHQADLILVKDKPLQNLSTVKNHMGVMVRGKWIPAAQIEQRLLAIKKRMGQT